MQRLTITVDDELLDAIDHLVSQRGYGSRSEAIRDSLRTALAHTEPTTGRDAHSFGILSYVFEHELRDLAKRLTNLQHGHHELSVSTLHVHTNQTDCLEVAVLKGHAGDIKDYADGIATQRGVRHANLHLIPEKN